MPSSKSAYARKVRGYYDYNILAVVVILICFGLVMLYSASFYESLTSYENDMYYLEKQVVISGGALLFAIIISKLDYHLLLKFAPFLYGLSLVLMAAVKYSPLGWESNGARRWLWIGSQSLRFQPSEIAKIAVILFVTLEIMRLGRDFYKFKGVCRVFILGFIQAFGAYYLTDNLSTAIIIMAIDVGMIFIAHPKTRPFIILLLILVVVVGLTVFLIWNYASASDGFRVRRILTWLYPEEYSEYGGYQVLQGLYAIGSGASSAKVWGTARRNSRRFPRRITT